MITIDSRAYALAVSREKAPTPPKQSEDQKAYTYGLLAKVMGRVALPSPAEVIGRRQPGSIGRVTDLLRDVLRTNCIAVLEADTTLLDQLQQALNERHLSNNQHMAEVVRNLHGGINTAMDIELATLATIQRRVTDGDTITRAGLMKSQRVPFAFALQSLATLNLGDAPLFERVFLPHKEVGTEQYKVFRDDKVAMSPTTGLRLVAELPQAVLHPKFADEPTVGCPVTLVSSFVRDLHVLAADTCMRADLLSVIDN
jgi:hypothetical protein